MNLRLARMGYPLLAGLLATNGCAKHSGQAPSIAPVALPPSVPVAPPAPIPSSVSVAAPPAAALVGDQLAAAEIIWEAVLRRYLEPTYFSEGNQVINTMSMGGNRPLGPAPAVMMTVRTATLTPFRPAWLATLAARGIAIATCDSVVAKTCGGNRVTTFVTLLDPTIRGDSAVATTSESAFNPAACGGPFQESFRGSRNMRFTVVRGDSGWKVMRSQLTSGGSGTCK